MNVVTVMEELGDALDTISGLRVFRYAPDSIVPPAGIIAYPEALEYAESYQRGMDRITIPVVIVGGKVSDRASSVLMAAYVSGSGSKSIKAVLDNYGSYTEADDVTVKSAEFDVFTMHGVEFISAVFEVDIVGSGA